MERPIVLKREDWNFQRNATIAKGKMMTKNMTKITQKDKQARGTKGEEDITSSLHNAGLWNHKIYNAGWGTPFDKIVVPPGGAYAVEVKLRDGPKIEYSKISESERIGLTKFMRQVGQGNAFIIGIWKTEKCQRAFLIPWYQVRDAVCSGVRGSIHMVNFPELPKVRGGWDMGCFKGKDDWTGRCMICLNLKSEGHKPDCKLAALLREESI
jgi:Holliday junction resolvase